MADHATAHHQEHEGEHHSASHYVKIWAILLVLLIISIIGPEIGITWVTLITAFGIAFVKAGLVVKHFMHLTIEKPIVWYILITCLVFLILFFAGVSPDVMKHDGSNWSNVAAKAEVERRLAEHAAVEAGEQVPVDGSEDGKAVALDGEPSGELDEISYADVDTDEQRVSWLMKRGEEVYLTGGAEAPSTACVACHRENGTGLEGYYPTLVGQKDHMGDCATTANIIRNGMSEPIEVDGVTYTRPMPPSIGLADIEVAAVATFVRNSWGNEFGICTPDDI